jgi:prophage regulatory protein
MTSGLEVKMSNDRSPFGAALVVRRPWEFLGISSHTWYLMRKRGEVPAPIKLGRRALGWRTADLLQWLQERQGEGINFRRRTHGKQ